MPSIAELSFLVILMLWLSTSEGVIASSGRTYCRCRRCFLSVTMSCNTVFGFMLIGASSQHKVGKPCFMWCMLYGVCIGTG